MQKRLILDNRQLDITISRLCQQLIENHDHFADSVILGMQPRGIFLAERINKRLKEIAGINLSVGYLDATFYRDDFRRRETPLRANATRIPFLIEGKKVILIDDVLYTGRSVRAALDAMNAFGRPAKVELLVLIDRKYTRDLPIEATYVGKQVNSIQTQRVLVEWTEQGSDQDHIWLVN
jgi:pyrimidine operon attenuation protein/uracil phosphoribosyltransferase